MDHRRERRRSRAATPEHPDKFATEEKIFANIRPGDRIFLGTACAEPQYLVPAADRVRARRTPRRSSTPRSSRSGPSGWRPTHDDRLARRTCGYNSFFIGNNTRAAVNQRPGRLHADLPLAGARRSSARRLVPIDVALIQVSLPDEHGYFSLGLSVDIVKAAVESAAMVVAQVNPRMPRVYGDGFVHLDQIDFAVVHEEPLLEFERQRPGRDRPPDRHATSPASSRTATPSRSATAASPTPFSPPSRARSTSACTPSCSDRRHRRPDAPRA